MAISCRSVNQERWVLIELPWLHSFVGLVPSEITALNSAGGILSFASRKEGTTEQLGELLWLPTRVCGQLCASPSLHHAVALCIAPLTPKRVLLQG